MFTGIIEEQGTVTAVESAGDGIRLSVRAPLAVSDAAQGDSIAISGVCLTVVAQTADTFTADVMRQTLEMTTIGALTPGDAVNVERAVSAHTRLGGHIVQGHVDGTGTVREVRPGAQWQVVRIGMPVALAPHSQPKSRNKPSKTTPPAITRMTCMGCPLGGVSQVKGIISWCSHR